VSHGDESESKTRGSRKVSVIGTHGGNSRSRVLTSCSVQVIDCGSRYVGCEDWTASWQKADKDAGG
jgi:hypothetical protein